MPEIAKTGIPPFIRLARLLDLGLFPDAPSDSFKALVPATDKEWEELFLSARNNRALAPLSYIFAAKPAFGALAGEEELSAMQEWHQAFAFRSHEIRKQIIELAELFAQHDQRLILLKGASRLFDGLYPDISCRYSIDIDPLIENPSMLYETYALGYQLFDDPSHDMKAIREGDISSLTGTLHHHLPPLYRDGEQASVELHTHPFSPKFNRLSIPDLWNDAGVVGDMPNILVPSLPDQIIINVIHTLLHGLAKKGFRISIRDLVEGHILYSKVNERQKTAVRKHFADAGYSKDFDLWLSVCFRVFGNPDYEVQETRSHRRFFQLLEKTQADQKTMVRYHYYSKLREMLFVEIWNPDRLRIRFRHLGTAAFWKRASALFKKPD